MTSRRPGCGALQVDRVRTLYGKFVEWDSTHVAAWVMFADLETSLQVRPLMDVHGRAHINHGTAGFVNARMPVCKPQFSLQYASSLAEPGRYKYH